MDQIEDAKDTAPVEDVDDSAETLDNEEVKTEDTNEEDSTLETLAALDDDQFKEYMLSGRVPEGVSTKTVVPTTKDVPKETEDVEVKADASPNAIDTPKDTTSDKKVNVNKEQSNAPIDYKTAYEQIFKPFKANGKEITPRNIEDIISLMQMGANYTKKMQTMSGMRKTVESLNKAEIKEDDLNFLIDVHRGDKEAIKKLLGKHKIDPIDLDMETTNYVPKSNILSNEDVEYSEVLDTIQGSLPKIQEIVTKQWDSKSKEALLKDPMLLKALHEEIQMGRFDEAQSRLELEKTFGRYRNVSDVEAYIDIVTKMVTERQGTNSTQNKGTVPNNSSNSKSKAAPTSRSKAAQSNAITSKEIFDMSEDDFLKLKTLI